MQIEFNWLSRPGPMVGFYVSVDKSLYVLVQES
jgi:hypothetical protein